jgi:hypothetical protein
VFHHDVNGLEKGIRRRLSPAFNPTLDECFVDA